mmetsp:Transcript_17207/g.44264  ORF Transcript_17207/g.44264 Transcript_17207/m.44264 type:complete len:524 (+) Transcript_17207:59-1630(+)
MSIDDNAMAEQDAESAGTYTSEEPGGGFKGHLAGRSGHPLWPAFLALFLQLASFSLTVPYISEIASKAPWSLRLGDGARCAGPSCPVRSEEEIMEDAVVRSQTIISAMQSTNAGFQLLSSGVLGVMCDRIGPKPVAIVSLLGAVVRLCTLTLCSEPMAGGGAHIQEVFAALVLASAINGVCGDLKISVQAYVAQCSPPERSSRNFGKMSASIGLAFCIGPGLNIFLTKGLGVSIARKPLLIGVVTNVVALLVVVFAWPWLKVSPEQKASAPWSNASPWTLIKVTLWQSTPLMMYAAIYFIDGFATDMVHSAFMVFVRKVFHWRATAMSLLMMVQGTCVPIILGCVLPRLLRRCGELPVLKIGALSTLAQFLAAFLIGLGGRSLSHWFYVVPFLGAVSALANPVLMALSCRELPREEMGRLAGALGFVETIAKIISPLVAGEIMTHTLKGPIPSIVFLAAAGIVLPSVVLCWFVKPKAALAGEDVQTEASSGPNDLTGSSDDSDGDEGEEDSSEAQSEEDELRP